MRFLIIIFFICQSSFAQKLTPLIENTLNFQLDSALNFLINSQLKTTEEGKQYSGEWKSFMELSEPYFFLGKKQKAQDSNCFTVSAIHNFLSEIYLKDTSRQVLLPVLTNAYKEILSYQNGMRFNFWKKLPPNRKLKWVNEPSPQPLVRRPTNFKLGSRFVNNAANIPEDADDTSLGNLATFYQNQIFGTKENLISPQKFDEYLDFERNNRNWFNILFLRNPNSKAFLTWQYPEQEYSQWNVAKSALSVFLIFFPGSTSKPVAYKPWVPFGANEVDIVVNANVISYLSITKETQNSLGFYPSQKLINLKLNERSWTNSSVYYSNQYHIHYAVSRAYYLGAINLKESCDIILKNIIGKQEKDGSLKSRSFINKYDQIQSTAYALHALLDLKKSGFNVPNENINRALNYLLANKKTANNGIFWEGGVFFSGGTVLRNILFWKSDAYTTALIAKCIQDYISLNI